VLNAVTAMSARSLRGSVSAVTAALDPGRNPRLASSARGAAGAEPAPAPPPVGAGAPSAAGGAAGFFFFGVAALAALVASSLPRVICALRAFGAARAPQPFVLLLERPG
jgi:hypothetical protein